LDRSVVLNWKAVAAALTLVVTFWAARMSDRIGRRRMLVIAGVIGIVAAFPLITLLSHGAMWSFALAMILGNGVVQGLLYGAGGARRRVAGCCVRAKDCRRLGTGRWWCHLPGGCFLGPNYLGRYDRCAVCNGVHGA